MLKKKNNKQLPSQNAIKMLDVEVTTFARKARES